VRALLPTLSLHPANVMTMMMRMRTVMMMMMMMMIIMMIIVMLTDADDAVRGPRSLVTVVCARCCRRCRCTPPTWTSTASPPSCYSACCRLEEGGEGDSRFLALYPSWRGWGRPCP
jgi:hypothetical protein